MEDRANGCFNRFGLKIPPNYNPSDFYIQQLAIYPKTKEENLAQIHVSHFNFNRIDLSTMNYTFLCFQYICDQYEKSPLHARYISEIVQFHANYEDDEELPFFAGLFYKCWPFKEKSEKVNQNDDDDDVQHRKRSRYATNGWTQFRWLVWRTLVNIFKNPFEIQLRLILAIVRLIYMILNFASA